MREYYEHIKAKASFSMQDVIETCRSLTPSDYKTRPYRYPDLHNGVALLDNEDALNCYIAAYGEMHMIKCRSALQNFPFDNISGSIEIVDWGCGQGIGSMCVVDCFKEHDLLQWLKQITLIEPSKFALERAEINLTIATNGAVCIQPIQSYLPGAGKENEIHELGYRYKNVIHIFSNILDIDSIDLGKLANIVSDKSRNNIILCIGPKNSNAYKIEQFCSIFGEQDYFSNVDDSQYGKTSDTFYTFTCKTKCFVYNGNPLNVNNIENIMVPDFTDSKNTVYNEYDPRLAVQNGIISEELRLIYLYLLNQISPNDIILIKQKIYGKKADLVLICEKKGILIINICNRFLTKSDVFDDVNEENEHEENDINPIEDENNIFIKDIVETRLEFFRQNELLFKKTEEDKKNYSLVKTAIFFTENTTEEIKEIFEKEDTKYISLLGKDVINNKTRMMSALNWLNLNQERESFDKQLFYSLLKELTPKWHSYRQGKSINLTTIQRNLSQSIAKRKQKISGVAGAGKTQVLATRAVNAQIRTGGNILILTYNKTLSNYLRYRINDVRADFYWNKLHISHYHHFFKEQAQTIGKHVYFNSFDDTTFFDNKENDIEHFDAIFIDEVQSYKSEWLQILYNKFLKENGEFVVFGDPKQNIYNRDTDSNGDIRIGVIGGEWNRQLSKCHRFANNQLTSLAKKFQNDFGFINADNFEKAELLQDGMFTCLKYMYNNSDININKLTQIISSILRIEGFDVNETVILGQNSIILKDIEYNYRKTTDEPTITTFIPIDEKNKLKDDTVKKLKFTMMDRGLKFSTIHSFQGWDAANVIILLQPEGDGNGYTINSSLNKPEVIYTAITRSKQNIVIINNGNTLYHNFFKRNMINEDYTNK